MTKGVLLIALKSKQYVEFARNMAASIRLYSPDIAIQLAVSGDLYQYAQSVPVDSITLIPAELYEVNERFEPGWCKLNMDKLTGFDRTLYLDVDGIVLRDIAPLFEYDGFRSQVSGTYNTGESWPCQWATMDEVRRLYDVDSGKPIDEINSSIILFDKSDSELFNIARSCYRKQHNGRWGGAFPDELGFNVALCKLGRSASFGFNPIKFEPDGSRLNKIASEYYILGLYGGILSRMVMHYNYYDQIAQVAARRLGFTAQKAHHLIRHKHVQRNKDFKPKQIQPELVESVNVAELPIFIGVTTMNRPDILEKTLRQIKRFTPGVKVVVYDDASTLQGRVKIICDLYGANLIASDNRRGVAYGKNMLLAAFMRSGAEYAFLFDDDCRPLRHNWWQPYIDSGLHHCTLSFDRLRSGRQNGNKVIERNGNIEYYNNPCGVMLFYSRQCIDRIGGMDLGYGVYGHEHVGHSYRIYNAGLTESPFLSLKDSIKWFESDDYNSTARVSYKKPKPNNDLLEQERNSCDWKPIEQGKYVIGALYTKVNNPQGARLNEADYMKWAESVKRFGYTPILFTDVNEAAGVKIVRSECPTGSVPNAYRFVALAEYICCHLTESEVWCTDVTDVVMLNQPKPIQGKLYVGSEVPAGWEWMNSLSEGCPFWDEINPEGILYNCGIMGGIGRTIMDAMLQMSQGVQMCSGLHDMHTLNWIAQNRSDIVTGKPVHNVFKSYKAKSEWFMHK